MRASSFAHRFWLPFERPRVFALFSDPDCLDLLTPSWFRLRPAGKVPSPLAAGCEISYDLRWRGLRLPWVSRLTDWREPSYLVYEQKRGPYRYFRHEHIFEPEADGTTVIDRVVFSAPGGRLADRLIAYPDLRRIFSHRETRAREILRTRVDSRIPIARTGELENEVADEGSTLAPRSGHRRHRLHRRPAGAPAPASRVSSALPGAEREEARVARVG